MTVPSISYVTGTFAVKSEGLPHRGSMLLNTENLYDNRHSCLDNLIVFYEKRWS